ncbi:MAG: putative DNA binding domain-containing protein [Propionibacteriaceae bacterium]|jgi:ATP-dependent DNA helicase RecG|nr:putative DNA binding domain-containing protein [Propionibacteriaceae bacterium]
MAGQDMLGLLDRLIAGWEGETVEFKEASRDYSTDKIGSYFSALSNEANLRNAGSAWLVFGVCNKSRTVVGTNYRPDPERQQSLKWQIAQGTEPSVTFRDIHEVAHPSGRVMMLEIPPAPTGIPIAWHGHYYARAGESLVSLGLDKQDQIRHQSLATDWSAQIVPGATLDDFDPGALDHARRAFARKYPRRLTEGEVFSWPVAMFTDRARLTLGGEVTRAGLLLVGRAESAGRLTPHPAQLTWSLVGQERAYEHFSTPFLLSTTALWHRIRNVQLRLIRPGTLLQTEVSKYDERIVLEAIHNAVAHQDFLRAGRVLAQEYPDRLVVTNQGEFFEGLPEEYATGGRSPSRYRNAMLAQAMVELGMIDTLGYGIFDMHNRQAHRFLPMPDYDLSTPTQVRLTIHGAVVDEAYTNLLMQRTDLPLADVLALDRVQKGLTIPEKATRRLRRAGLVEGRKPHLRVASVIVDATATEPAVKSRSGDEQLLLQVIVDHLAVSGSATRRDIDALLDTDLADDSQRMRRVTNLLTKLRRDGLIANQGTKASPVWVLAEQQP